MLQNSLWLCSRSLLGKRFFVLVTNLFSTSCPSSLAACLLWELSLRRTPVPPAHISWLGSCWLLWKPLAVSTEVDRAVGASGISSPHKFGENTWLEEKKKSPWKLLEGKAGQNSIRVPAAGWQPGPARECVISKASGGRGKKLKA